MREKKIVDLKNLLIKSCTKAEKDVLCKLQHKNINSKNQIKYSSYRSKSDPASYSSH